MKKLEIIAVCSTIVVGITGIVFILLRLLNVFQWSWWWVTAPLWAPWMILLSIIAVEVVVATIHDRKEFKRRRLQ